MVTCHSNDSDPFTETALDTPARLLEALAGLNLDPAEAVPVETAIMLASRLGLTQQELHEARTELVRRMRTESAPASPGGPKRMAKRGARGIPARIEGPQTVRFQTPLPELAEAPDYPADLYADQPETVRARVYQVVRENAVDLRYPVAVATCQAIAYAANTSPVSLRGILNHIRVSLGLVARKGRGKVTPIRLEGTTPAPAGTTLIEQVGEIIDTRGIDLRYLPPDGFVRELMEQFDRTEDSIRTVLKTIRKKRGLRGTGRPLPGSKPRPTPAVAKERETLPMGNTPDPRALALAVAVELQSVKGKKRAQALIQAGRLLEKVLG